MARVRSAPTAGGVEDLSNAVGAEFTLKLISKSITSEREPRSHRMTVVLMLAC
jgi:hypothetical protein